MRDSFEKNEIGAQDYSHWIFRARELGKRGTERLRSVTGRLRLPNARRTGGVIAGALLVLALSGFAFLEYQAAKYDSLIEHRLRGGAFNSSPIVMAAPRTIRRGAALDAPTLQERLLRAGYVAEGDSPIGSFSVGDNEVSIRPGPLSISGVGPARIAFSKERVQSIRDANGQSLRSYRLEPEAITRLADAQGARRKLLRYEEIPRYLIDAIIAVEDHRFYKHSGIDVVRTVKAAWEGVVEWRKPQGTSTLTQQLARSLFLTQEQSYSRKLKEFLIAYNIERRLSKERILELYCNLIYMGRQGRYAISGVGEAAQTYFAKDVGDLTLEQAALLAGLPQRPNYLNPFRHPERAKARRNVVLAAMRSHGYISDGEFRELAAKPLGVVERDFEAEQAPYFVDLLKRELDAQPELAAGLESGGEIYTTLDAGLQEIAVRTVRKVMAEIDPIVAAQPRFRGQQAPRPQCALVAIDPRSGAVKALVGGRDYERTQLNRVLAKRQPGSLFKPFVFAAALSSEQPYVFRLTPLSIVQDSPLSIEWEENVYQPSNYGYEPTGFITLREALVHSANTATVRVAREVGYGRVARLARAAGLEGVRATPSAALGAYEVTPLDMAGAYSIFANGGKRVRPRLIEAVRSAASSAVARKAPEERQVIDAGAAYLVADMMADVLNRGTGARARSLGFYAPAAGKTGTDEDGWFAGFTDRLLCVVWVGFDDNLDLQIEGSKSALPVWAEFMKRAQELPEYANPQPLERPETVVEAVINPFLRTSMPAEVELPESELFLADSLPMVSPAVIQDPEPEIEESFVSVDPGFSPGTQGAGR